jgi:hypothetical protein
MEQLPKFTEDEQGFINHCFKSTLHVFLENPLKRDNIEDMRKAINYRNYNIGSIGKENHILMWSIFDKIGYCKDGKMTKDEEHKRQMALEQEKVELWANQRDIAISECDEKIAELQQIKRDLISHDIKFNEVVKEKAKVVQEEFKEQVKEERKESRNMLIRESQNMIDQMTVRELRVLCREKGIKNYSRINKAEMKIAIKEAN